MSHNFPLTRRRVATPVDWRQGGAVIVAPSVKPEDAPALFPKGVKQHEVPSGKVRTEGWERLNIILSLLLLRAT